MPRILTADMAQAIREHRPLALLVEVDHPLGLKYYWTGVGDLEYNGVTWIGTGILGSVTPVKRTNDLAIQEVQLTLVGIDPEKTEWLSANVRNRLANAWLACVVNGIVVPDPYKLVELRLDYQSFNISEDGIASVSINALTGFTTLERALNEIWSDQDQKTRFPADTGFNMLTLLQNKEVKWTVS